MAGKVETKITRPNIFHECRTCIVARRIVDAHLAFEPTLPFVSIETSKIDITCEVNDQTVMLADKSEYVIQFVASKRKIPIETGNVSPQPVRCPHFSAIIRNKNKSTSH